MYKMKLQELCQKRQWGLPKYLCMKDGPDHVPFFKASVSVNGLLFHSLSSANSSKLAQNDAARIAFLHFTSPPSSGSQMASSDPSAGEPEIGEAPQSDDTCSQLLGVVDGSSKTLKEVQLDAARVALMSVSLDGFQKECFHIYKNLLQELAQREDLYIPVYRTVKSGASHMPTFISSVEVEGEIFYGTAGKSKKEAETKAAKVAYSSLKERALSRSIAYGSTNLVVDENLKSTSSSSSDFDITVDTHQHAADQDPLDLTPAIRYEEKSKESKDEIQELNSPEKQSTTAKLISEDMDKKIENQGSSTCSQSVPALSVSESTEGKVKETKSYLLCNRVRVYPCFPDIAFPKGITVLPISENRWVAVSLEFPNEHDN